MANDRVFLRCDKCGDDDLLLLYTMMGAGLDVYRLDPARYYDWLEAHREHHPHPYGDLKGNPGFSVTTESTSDEHTYETAPCDHPTWKQLHEGAYESPTVKVTRKQCTTCGHKVTATKRLVAREIWDWRAQSGIG